MLSKKNISSLKEIYATSGELEGTDTIIEALVSVDSVIETAEQTVQARLANGGDESVLLFSSKDDVFSVFHVIFIC